MKKWSFKRDGLSFFLFLLGERQFCSILLFGGHVLIRGIPLLLIENLIPETSELYPEQSWEQRSVSLTNASFENKSLDIYNDGLWMYNTNFNIISVSLVMETKVHYENHHPSQ